MFKRAFRNLFRKKLRSLLTILAIGIGVFSVVLIGAMGDIGQYTIEQELNSIGISGVAISTAAKQKTAQLYQEDLTLVQNADSIVAQATPLMVQYATARMRGLESEVLVFGVDEHAPNVVSLELLCGRMLRKADIAAASKACIVDEAYAQAIYGRTNIVGKTVSLMLGSRFEQFEIVGVVASGGNLLQGLMGQVVPTFFYIPYSTLTACGEKMSFDQIAVTLHEHTDPDKAGQTLARLLASAERPLSSIRIENLSQQKQALDGILEIVTTLLSAIGSISLIVAGISIMTVMLVSVSERTREIGIKKSIGAGRGDILGEFMLEALLMSIIGSVLGAAVAVLSAWLGCVLLGIVFVLDLTAVAVSIVFATTVGVLFGVYPAIVASRLSPVDALRTE